MASMPHKLSPRVPPTCQPPKVARRTRGKPVLSYLDGSHAELARRFVSVFGGDDGSKRGRLKLRPLVQLLPEDRAFLTLVSKSAGLAEGAVLAHVWRMLCRTLRTGRDPVTGELLSERGPVPAPAALVAAFEAAAATLDKPAG